ncbi:MULTISPECIES: SIS domain-containing protein [unclassified Mesorhizobium]|uniref:SIS domain-containing protein n=1 Tax=unclassified Mesorhizobium TaxID=325217 RepID=UPI000F74CDDD|nr:MULTISPECIES: SIS domain-containing protein [unclassified Mesorhizobium]TGV92015.1 SIS domain-containing protein [Mesorhizobium sp. M00.F.Ca.ET.158.01.1.1]AZO58560.1 SIS domain-containing protein [Mesorhizobium sp. M1A.F.Ca.IN.022.06.1.1]MCT2579332.1 SIS domain-containing protein [Mesorhizobium sp. P13.3]MDF3168494.1 SIS domain-containing protein [Mesorhizobium sp. P16.1]MDF3178093.1 SIS domain-containing protein [Mesorhizobium sp. P17.1]
MLNFDEARFVRIQSGAVALRERIETAVAQCLAAGAQNIFFLGTGGAAILMHPAAQLLQRRSGFPAFVDITAELQLAQSVHLTEKSIVVLPSLSGTTKESVALLARIKEIGATVIALVGHEETPLGRGGDHVFVNFAEDDTSCESFYLQSLFIALSVLKHRGELAESERIFAELAQLPRLLLEVKRSYEKQAADFAQKLAASDYHIITGAGNVWPQAWYYGMCILEEMQWIRTRPVHASDFFHGTLELVEKDVSVVLFKGDDSARPLAERVENFAANYTDKTTVLDTAAFELPGISADVRALVSPVVLATALERVSAHLEVIRNHPLTTRRYYKRVAY